MPNADITQGGGWWSISHGRLGGDEVAEGPGDVHRLGEGREVVAQTGVHAGRRLLLAEFLVEGEGILRVGDAEDEIEPGHIHELGQTLEQHCTAVRVLTLFLHELKGRLPMADHLLPGEGPGRRLPGLDRVLDRLLGDARPAGQAIVEG